MSDSTKVFVQLYTSGREPIDQAVSVNISRTASIDDFKQEAIKELQCEVPRRKLRICATCDGTDEAPDSTVGSLLDKCSSTHIAVILPEDKGMLFL